MYPWGDELPDSTRACFAAEKPAKVGAYPAGQGPFGALDQAGNVWEWCLDVWNEKIYATRAKRGAEVVDPVVDTADTKENQERRVLRGGSWRETTEEAAVLLAAAFRSRHWLDVVLDSLGFRVVVAPASRPSRS